MNKITCSICEGSAQPCFISGDHRFYRCVSCRTAFVHPQPTPQFLEKFYNNFHAGFYDEVETRMQDDFPAKIKLIQDKSSGNRVLDVGCGKGFFVKACSDAGFDAEGIDLSESGVEYATQTLGVRARAGRIEDASDLKDFDVATFWATIEHLPAPIETIRTIGNALKPKGLLFLDTGIGDDWHRYDAPWSSPMVRCAAASLCILCPRDAQYS